MISDPRHKKNIPDEKLFYLPNGANVEMFHPLQDFHSQKQKSLFMQDV